MKLILWAGCVQIGAVLVAYGLEFEGTQEVTEGTERNDDGETCFSTGGGRVPDGLACFGSLSLPSVSPSAAFSPNQNIRILNRTKQNQQRL